MIEIIRANDPVLINAVEALLRGAGLSPYVADGHVSAIEGSIGAFPRRILIPGGEEAQARRLLTEAGLGGELREPR
ncbi:MAG: hypothetical protein BGP06_18115 [Rhizobiales bacterium 65-9]|nr:DUF2007 domain-containing protein [Hyphomicrobiales bacterium]OJY34752.1 MAG: hypothetical protein BGP06_18115 [Rhizobiales bacterium 65-9]